MLKGLFLWLPLNWIIFTMAIALKNRRKNVNLGEYDVPK